MDSKRKGLLGVLALALLCLICVLLFFRDHPPPPRTAKPAEESVTRRSDSPDENLPLPKTDSGTTRAEMRRRFGVLVWPGMAVRSLNYSRTILSWMQEWGFECGFVRGQGSGGNEAFSPLPADVTNNAWDLPDASESLNSIVLADGDLPPADVAAVKEYLLSGGWAIMPSPREKNVSKDAEDLLRFKQSRTATLTVLDSPSALVLSLELGGGQLRPLVNHPAVPTLATGRWLTWQGPSAKVHYTKQDEALPLLSFLCPEVPAVRLVPFGEGGVLHWNFALHFDALTEDTEVKALLEKGLAWLSDRRN